MMMIPEAWQKQESMDASKRAFYEFHSCLMEPWTVPRRLRLPMVVTLEPSSIAMVCVRADTM